MEAVEVEKRLAEIIQERGIKISAIASGTGIPTGALYPCFKGRRKMQAVEFLQICKFLGVSTDAFQEQKGA